jgi:surfeit locus 1 family protein
LPARRLLWPGLTTALMLALAIGLGIWQLQRLAWKTALLAEIDQGEAASAVPLPADPRPFTKVRVEGLLRQDLAALYGIEVRTTQAGPILGAFLLNPLERPGADPIIVDRGWVPADAPRDDRPVPATIEGYIRPPEHPVRFGAADDPAARRFYALDPAAIGASLGLRQVAPFTLVALGEAPRGTYPEPVQALPRPPNNHFIYALTWFGLALALMAVFGVYARRLLRTP